MMFAYSFTPLARNLKATQVAIQGVGLFLLLLILLPKGKVGIGAASYEPGETKAAEVELTSEQFSKLARRVEILENKPAVPSPGSDVNHQLALSAQARKAYADVARKADRVRQAYIADLKVTAKNAQQVPKTACRTHDIIVAEDGKTPLVGENGELLCNE